jgi:hypothetical protein
MQRFLVLLASAAVVGLAQTQPVRDARQVSDAGSQDRDHAPERHGRGTTGAQAAGDWPALARGFAVATSDTGHQSAGGAFDGSFMRDQQAALNFEFVAIGRLNGGGRVAGDADGSFQFGDAAGTGESKVSDWSRLFLSPGMGIAGAATRGSTASIWCPLRWPGSKRGKLPRRLPRRDERFPAAAVRSVPTRRTPSTRDKAVRKMLPILSAGVREFGPG